MADTFTVACIQTNAAPDAPANIIAATGLIRQARDAGADFILLPETVNMMEPKNSLLREKVALQDDDQTLRAFQSLARETGAWILAGSIILKLPGETKKAANRSLLIGPDGNVTARYDKIHMFDVDLGNEERYRESSSYEPGAEAVLTDLPWGRLGMSICYDIRFPHLYRHLAKGGADYISIPSAFTRTSGKAHWHVLARARAIETGCYVFAPAQCGDHAGNRQTFGHSLIVDPWGNVLADGGEDIGFITAEIDPDKVSEARQKIPSLTHDRPYT